MSGAAIVAAAILAAFGPASAQTSTPDSQSNVDASSKVGVGTKGDVNAGTGAQSDTSVSGSTQGSVTTNRP